MYKLLCDVSNINISPDYGHNIPRDTILDLPEEIAERLTRIGAAVPVESPAPVYDPEILISDLPDDLEQLKDIADQHEIKYAANIGADTLKDRISEFLRGA